MIIWQSEETYKAKFSNRDEVIQTAKDLACRGLILCAICIGQMKYHGCYSRHILDEGSNREQGWAAQVCCAACGKYPALLPEFIMPYKHYEAGVIEGVIAASENGVNVERSGGCAADVSTMRRWVRQFKERGVRVVSCLISLLIKLYDRHISVLKLQNMTLLRQLARLLREFPMSKNGKVIGNANIIITALNCGFL